MGLMDKLEEWRVKGRPIGFSPWRDAETMLWGVITSFTEKSITVDEISPLGKPDGEGTYKLSSISYFDDDKVYSERLLRLAEFIPTLPNNYEFETKRPTVKAILAEAHQTNEILRVRLLSVYGSRTFRVTGLDGKWVTLTTYDDLMVEGACEVWRVSAVRGVRWRTANEESKEFLSLLPAPRH
ncbi:MAG: hypothetical protein K8R88_12185 [Armatimonadetes bacterium]|nr:hypothetical protein [Armatimonadota bacterium]